VSEGCRAELGVCGGNPALTVIAEDRQECGTDSGVYGLTVRRESAIMER
jgi:hypothetical protein